MESTRCSDAYYFSKSSDETAEETSELTLVIPSSCGSDLGLYRSSTEIHPDLDVHSMGYLRALREHRWLVRVKDQTKKVNINAWTGIRARCGVAVATRFSLRPLY